MQVCKTDINVTKIQLLSVEKDIKGVEMSINNTHLCLEKVEDRVNGFVESIWRMSSTCQAKIQLFGLEIQQVQKESREGYESLLGKFARNNDIIDKKFIQLDTELERVVDLVGEKIKTKVGSIASDFAEVMEIEETWFASSEAKTVALEKMERACEEITRLSRCVAILQGRVGELEDAIMEEAGLVLNYH
jgi:hypothetical protein